MIISMIAEYARAMWRRDTSFGTAQATAGRAEALLNHDASNVKISLCAVTTLTMAAAAAAAEACVKRCGARGGLAGAGEIEEQQSNPSESSESFAAGEGQGAGRLASPPAPALLT